MSRKLATLVLVVCILFAFNGGNAAFAQANLVVPITSPVEVVDQLWRCSSWSPVPWDKLGTRRVIFPVTIGDRREARIPGRYVIRGKEFSGEYIFPGNLAIGLVSDPNGNRRSHWFTTQVGSTVAFVTNSFRLDVKSGHFETLIYNQDIGEKPCIKGKSTLALEELTPEKNLTTKTESKPEVKSKVETKEEPRPRLEVEPTPKSESSLGDIAEKLNKESAPKHEGGRSLEKKFAAESSREAPRPRSSLGDVMLDPAKRAENDEPAKPAEKNPSERIERKSEAPTLKTPTPDSSAPMLGREAAVCRADDLKPLALTKSATLASLQLVGLRNDLLEAEGFDFLSVSGDALPLNANFDIADSRGKLVPFETFSLAQGRSPDSIWVSMLGAGQFRAKQKRGATQRAIKTLRVIVIGGAQEVAISGLEALGRELAKPNGGRAALDIEWHVIEEKGSIKLNGRYASLEQLVGSAARIASGRRPDVLDEQQLSTMFDNFEKLLTKQPNAIDKVVWVKGAYAIPASFPQRLERFLEAVSESKTVVRTPSGQIGKWLVVVTARMPGFSIAYLKEPIYSLQVGDVIEERDENGSGRRSLIGETEAKVLAARIQASLAVRRDATTSIDEPNPGAVTGTLVFDANEVFVQRGYVFSPEAAAELNEHLQHVLDLWNGVKLQSEILVEFIGKTGRPSPSLHDILQSSGGAYPKLPRTISDWIRKPVKDLTSNELQNAREFVSRYAAGAEKLERATIKFRETERRPNCAFFYASDEFLGFVKS